MSTIYSGNDAFPASFTIPSDGDGPGISAVDVNVAFEALGDRTVYLQRGLEPVVTVAANADTTVSYGTTHQTVLRFTSAITAPRVYTLGAAGADTNDIVTAFAESTLAQTVTIKDQGGVTLFELGNSDRDDGQWAKFIYIGGWRLLHGGQGCKIRSQFFGANGSFVVPRGVTKIIVEGSGGGGGGGGGAIGQAGDDLVSRGGGGGSAGQHGSVVVAVTPGATLTVNIGAGGTGGPSAMAGNDGLASGISGSITFEGGVGGRALAYYVRDVVAARGGDASPGNDSPGESRDLASVSPGGGGCSGSGLVLIGTSALALAGGLGAISQGGPGGTTAADVGLKRGGTGGGGGGGGRGGDGGGGGNGGAGIAVGIGALGTDGLDAAANSGGGGGGGGGGGAGTLVAFGGTAGGDGGSGFITISWVK